MVTKAKRNNKQLNQANMKTQMQKCGEKQQQNDPPPPQKAQTFVWPC